MLAILFERLEGKAVARTESGPPGAFDALDEFSTETLKEALRIIQGGRKNGPKDDANGDGQ